VFVSPLTVADIPARADRSAPGEHSFLRRDLTDHHHRKHAELLASHGSVAETDDVLRVRARATRETLRMVADAVARLDSGALGTCRRCGATISAARVEIAPHAEDCLHCRGLAEVS
jgi:RNA polymerase-binding transcription factor DksA